MHAGKNGARKLCTANSALRVICSLHKEPQNPHSGSKLTVPEQPLITRPRTLEKPVLTLPTRKQCLQTKLGQREQGDVPPTRRHEVQTLRSRRRNPPCPSAGSGREWYLTTGRRENNHRHRDKRSCSTCALTVTKDKHPTKKRSGQRRKGSNGPYTTF